MQRVRTSFCSRGRPKYGGRREQMENARGEQRSAWQMREALERTRYKLNDRKREEGKRVRKGSKKRGTRGKKKKKKKKAVTETSGTRVGRVFSGCWMRAWLEWFFFFFIFFLVRFSSLSFFSWSYFGRDAGQTRPKKVVLLLFWAVE